MSPNLLVYRTLGGIFPFGNTDGPAHLGDRDLTVDAGMYFDRKNATVQPAGRHKLSQLQMIFHESWYANLDFPHTSAYHICHAACSTDHASAHH
ncbi:MAG TPA: hypothetical protein PKD12_06485 [Nitrospira sp.]|nr:hypothetical protein [Nitrospira sp.]